jgi:hypothetical protein
VLACLGACQQCQAHLQFVVQRPLRQTGEQAKLVTGNCLFAPRAGFLAVPDYAYKRRFGVARLALVDLTASLSWRGIPYVLRDHAARRLRRHPRLAALVGRALGKPPSREEN